MAQSIRTGPNRYPALLMQAARARNLTSRNQRKPSQQTFRMMILANDGHRTWPATPRQSLTQCRHIGNVVEGFLGTANSQRERASFARAPFGFEHSRYCRFAERAGGHGVDGFHRKRHELAFCQCLHGAVYAIARIVSASNINYMRRH